MATLQKIRTRAGLLVAIVIGISLAAFILGDMFSSGGNLFQKDRLEVGVINGESIQYPEFQQELEEIGEIYRQNTQQSQLDEDTWVQIREQAWQNFIRKIVMGDVYENLGINVSNDELFDMIQGTNLHPIIQQMFMNPETGQVDRGAVVRFLKNLETGVAPETRNYWLYLEQQIHQERIQSKYINMVGKGLYVTSEEAQGSLTDRNKKVNFDYIALSYSDVADSLVAFTDKDLRDYYNANKNDYKQEKVRRIEYITYPVNPSAADYEEAEKWINDIKGEFELAEDNIQFVNSSSDRSFDGIWNKQDDLPENVGAWIFEENAEVNNVLGPYEEGNSFILAKLHALEMMPDSVQARHILLQVNTQAEVAGAQALADSLKTEIENGADFATLAAQHSADQGSAINGGDLGWFGRGMMVKPFEDAAFNNEKNEVTVVASQFGIHIVQTTGIGTRTKQAQVAYLVREVVPSSRTYQDTYAQASKFAGENTSRDDFDAAVSEQGLNKQVAQVRENDRLIGGLENARTLVRAAYEANEGEIITDTQGSPIFELGDNFVIAVLVKATEEGTMAFEDVRARVELNVIKEKKAEYLMDKIAVLEGNDLESIGAGLDATVNSASDVDFTAFSIPDIGMEPAVAGTVATLETDIVSQPVKGNNGVYLVRVTSVNEGVEEDVSLEQARLAQSMNFRAGSQALNVHREAVEIEDKRSKFY